MLVGMRTLCLPLALALSACSAAFSIPSAGQAAAQSSPVIYSQQEGFVDAHGVLIYYKSLGTGEPLVVLHGGPGASHDYFLPYLLPLARTHRLIFIDERGSGRSQRLEDASLYTVEAMVEDIEDVRVALNLGKISLLGHSCGGVLAQAYALKYQQNLSHLILNSTFPSTREMNEVLAHEKAQMPSAKLARLNQLEQAPAPTRTTTPRPAMLPPIGNSTAPCGARTGSLSSTAISVPSSMWIVCLRFTSPRLSWWATTTSALPR
jgi:proline iminopeptidase